MYGITLLQYSVNTRLYFKSRILGEEKCSYQADFIKLHQLEFSFKWTDAEIWVCSIVPALMYVLDINSKNNVWAEEN